MTEKKFRVRGIDLQEVFGAEKDGLREILREVLQEVLEAEMRQALGAEKGERNAERLGYRSGYYARSLMTRVGKLEPRVPQDRQGHFSTQLFERYQRSEKALVSALAEMSAHNLRHRSLSLNRVNRDESGFSRMEYLRVEIA